MNLRPYQIDLIERGMRSVAQHGKVIIQLPTGGGKTVCFCKIIEDYVNKGKRVLLLVHRKELIQQAAAKLFKMGINHGYILSGVQPAYSRPVQLASVQTLIRREMPKNIGVIITDECHHATADSYRKILDYYPDADKIGFTATPCRTNGEGFSEVYNDIVCGPSVKELIRDGYLVEPKIFSAPLHLDLSKVKKTAGDYNDKDLAALLDNAKYLADLYREWERHAYGKKTVVFAITIEHSKHIVEQYNSYGVPAAHIDGSTPDDERAQILKAFAEGKYMILSNVGIVTEGFDVPAIECVQLTRPTESLALYLQMVGRGLRTIDGKERCIILDHANCVFMHGFPQSDRVWTIHGVKKKKRKAPDGGDYVFKVVARDKTGRMFDVNDIPKDARDIELVEIEFSEARVAEMYNIMKEVKRRGHKPGAVYYRFCEKYGNPSVYELQLMQNKLGYKQGWIRHAMERHGHTTNYSHN